MIKLFSKQCGKLLIGALHLITITQLNINFEYQGQMEDYYLKGSDVKFIYLGI